MNNPLGPYAGTMLQIYLNFSKPLDNDVPTDEERCMSYYDEEVMNKEQSYDGDLGYEFSNNIGVDDDMMTLLSFELAWSTMPSYLILFASTGIVLHFSLGWLIFDLHI